MRACTALPTLMLIVNPLLLSAQGVEQLATALMSLPAYDSQARFEVLLPNAQEPVVYAIDLQSQQPAPGDSLAPCDYYISWHTESMGEPLSGFSAYFDGNHYRFRNNRLQEYHAQESLSPFMPAGEGSQAKGVQQCAQFADMLPQFIGAKLAEMARDTTYVIAFHPDTLISGQRRIAVDGSRFHLGYETSQFLYIFDPATGMPLSSSFINSPGSISEQLVDITYSPSQAAPIEISEQGLVDAWPDAFEKFRQSTFRVESLPGVALPGYSAFNLQGDRVVRHASDPMTGPTVIVALDPEVGTTEQTIADVREAAAMMPAEAAIVWAMAANDAEAAVLLLGGLQPGEQALLSAKSLMRNCGIGLFPTLIFVNSDGKVADVATGYNKTLPEIVIEKTMQLR